VDEKFPDKVFAQFSAQMYDVRQVLLANNINPDDLPLVIRRVDKIIRAMKKEGGSTDEQLNALMKEIKALMDLRTYKLKVATK